MFINISTEIAYTTCEGYWADFEDKYEDLMDWFWDYLYMDPEPETRTQDKILWLFHNHIHFVIEPKIYSGFHPDHQPQQRAYYELTQIRVKILDPEHAMLYKLTWD